MLYDIIIPKHYTHAVASAIAGKKLTGLSNNACRDVINAIADLARGSSELFGLVASLNMQYLTQFHDKKFKPAKIFQESDIAVGNIYLIHNKLVLIRSTYENRFVGVLVTSNIDIIVDCKRAMLIGSFTEPLTIPVFEVETIDCYVLYTPALGVFWGFHCDDDGVCTKVESVKDEKTLIEGVMHFVNGVEHNFNLLITQNPDDKDVLIEKFKNVIEQANNDISAKWFHFDEMELFHIPFSRVVKQA